LCHFEVPHMRDHTLQESLCHFDRREKSYFIIILRFLIPTHQDSE
jgi:hypothetical protein